MIKRRKISNVFISIQVCRRPAYRTTCRKVGKEHTLPAIYTFSKLFKTLFNMKKYILKLALLIASVVTGAAQNSSQILLNTQNAESGLRNLGTSDIIVRNGLADRHPLKVSLIAAETSTGWSYTIYIASDSCKNHSK